MKKLKHILFSLLFFSFLAASAREVLGGDVHPPFPWATAEPCAILTEDLAGYWIAKDDMGQELFYIYISVVEAEGIHYILFKQYVPVVDESGYVEYVLLSEGHGNISPDGSSITGVLVEGSQSGHSNWIYIYSLCANTGERQSVLELAPAQGNTENDRSEKYLFEKVPEDLKFSFTE